MCLLWRSGLFDHANAYTKQLAETKTTQCYRNSKSKASQDGIPQQSRKGQNPKYGVHVNLGNQGHSKNRQKEKTKIN